MKKADIKKGSCYTARVSGNFVTVRVDSITERDGYGTSKAGTSYNCTNLKTGRKVVFRSAMKFRYSAKVSGSRTGAKSVVGTDANPLGRNQTTPHPFVATPNDGPCSSCGKRRSDPVHDWTNDGDDQREVASEQHNGERNG